MNEEDNIIDLNNNYNYYCESNHANHNNYERKKF